MKKLITICVGLIVAGCATTTQLEEIEKRLARIEGDLYKVEVKSAPKVEKPEAKKAAQPKFVPAKEVEKNVVDAKIDAFLKEYLGVQFGDSIDKFPEMIDNRHTMERVVPVLKKFKYFDKAVARFTHGKLYRVVFIADIDAKYSLDSTNEKMEQVFADLGVTLGLASTAFNTKQGAKTVDNASKNPTSYTLYRHVEPHDWFHFGDIRPPRGFRRYGASISDYGLEKRLEEEARKRNEELRIKANATGENLPDPE